MGCCGGGFGNGSGTGNISGTLTPGVIPVASGIHTLSDSPLEVGPDSEIISTTQLVIDKTSKKSRTVLVSVAGAVAIDASDSDFYSLTLTENSTLQAPSNAQEGRAFLLRVKNTGGFTLGFHAIYRFSGGVPPVVPDGAFSYLGFAYNEDDDFWDEIGERLDFVTGS